MVSKRLNTKDIVVLSAIDWHFIWQRYQIISKLFADNGFSVFYVESTAKRNPKLNDVPRIIRRVLYRKKVNRPGENPIPESLAVISPVMLPATRNLFRSVNRLFFIKKFVHGLKERGIEKPLVYCYLPTQTSLDIIERLNPSLTIYDCVTNFRAFPGVPEDIDYTERRMIGQADLVFCDSDYLYQEKKKLRTDVKQVLPGVDFDLFIGADSGRLKELKILGYFGGIDDRIDFLLIERLAKSFKSIKIKMVGPVMIGFPRLPDNVVFVGRKRYRDLPDVLKDCDCLIFPYKINEYTKGIIPAKLFESFATGKPIISTALPNFDKYKNLMMIARNHEDFIGMVKNMSSLESEEKRRKRIEMAKENSWEARFKEISGYILEAFNKKYPRRQG